MKPIVQVEKLRKTYGNTVAVDEITFDVAEGEIFGIVGPNGAGKTTTIECLEGLRKPDSGLVQVLGVDPQMEGQKLCLRVGMQLQQSNLPDRMRVWEALDLYASFYPKAADWKELLVQLGLEEKRYAPFAKLSGGQKQRLFVALALLPNPSLVFLDELTTGLDPQARHAIWDLVRAVRSQGKTILLSTHFMEEAERLCDRVAIFDHGRVVALDSPAALVRGLDAEERVIFHISESMSLELRDALSQVGQVRVEEDQVIISARNGRKDSLVGEVVELLSREGVPFRDLRTEQASLEDVFLKLTGRAMRE